jgi:hypothetical protein
MTLLLGRKSLILLGSRLGRHGCFSPQGAKPMILLGAISGTISAPTLAMSETAKSAPSAPPSATPSAGDLETMLRAYGECALWSSTDDDGEPLDAGRDFFDLPPETVEAMRADCLAFATAHASAILSWPGDKAGRNRDPWGAAGHDLWLNRNGHGCGFWDGDWPEPAATELDEVAKALGGVDLYVGDDGRIYC